MIIGKKGKYFTVEEKKTHWNVFRRDGSSGVNYTIYKTMCPTVEDLVRYVGKSDLVK